MKTAKKKAAKRRNAEPPVASAQPAAKEQRGKKVTLQLLNPDGSLWTEAKLDARLVRMAEAYAARFGRTFADLVLETLEGFASDAQAVAAAHLRAYRKERA